MTGPLPPGAPTVFVSADWSKEVGKRSVWIADVRARKVLPAPARPWTLTSLMGLARGYSDAGPVLVGIDAALGVPREYWRLVRDARRSRSFANFVQWLRHLDPAGHSSAQRRTPGSGAWTGRGSTCVPAPADEPRSPNRWTMDSCETSTGLRMPIRSSPWVAFRAQWEPEPDPEARKRLFKEEHPDW